MVRGMLITGLVATLVVGCSSSPEQKSYEDESQKSRTVVSYGGGVTPGSRLLNIPVSVEYGLFGLMGTAADAYSVDLDGCLSGYDATVTEANLDGVEVYKDDRNCLAKLTSFTIGGVAYAAANPGATDFTTWLEDDVAIFTNAAGTQTIRVKVEGQLESPIAGTEAVVYNFSELLGGNDVTIPEADVSDAHLITVESQEAPLFNVVGTTLMGMDDITGAPEFRFKLECVDDPTAVAPNPVDMTNSVDGNNTVCGSNSLVDITYKLVKDTFGSTLTITDAETIFSTAGTGVTIPGDQYVDDPDVEEGFNTATLDGPGGLGTAGNENMILILKAGISYTYFNIDVTTISQ